MVGAKSVTRRAKTNTSATRDWVRSLLEYEPARIVMVAMVKKTARTAWAVLAKEQSYRVLAMA